MSRAWKYIAFVCLMPLVGCDIETDASSRRTSKGPVIKAASTENLSQVDHPEYVSWSRFPVGTAVVRRKVVSGEAESVQVITTLRLVEKSKARVVVENQITVERPGQAAQQNPILTVEFPATFPLPSGMRLEQFTLPSLKARPIGDGVHSAGGREFKAQVFTWDEVNEAGPMTVKLWRSDDIPGRMLRQEISGRNHQSIEEVVEIDLVESSGSAAK